MNPAPNLILVGPMGAGKSSIGRILAQRLGLHFVDVDQRLEEITGVTVPVIFDCEGEAGFRARERTLLAELCLGEGQVIATGGGAVLDVGTRRLLRRHGFVVHLHIDVAQQLERLARDRSRPLLQTPDRAIRLQQLAETRDPLYAEVADLRFDTGGSQVAAACERLLALLAVHWTGREAA